MMSAVISAFGRRVVRAHASAFIWVPWKNFVGAHNRAWRRLVFCGKAQILLIPRFQKMGKGCRRLEDTMQASRIERFLGRLQRGSRVQVPRLVRWRHKLEPGEVLFVEVYNREQYHRQKFYVRCAHMTWHVILPHIFPYFYELFLPGFAEYLSLSPYPSERRVEDWFETIICYPNLKKYLLEELNRLECVSKRFATVAKEWRNMAYKLENARAMIMFTADS